MGVVVRFSFVGHRLSKFCSCFLGKLRTLFRLSAEEHCCRIFHGCQRRNIFPESLIPLLSIIVIMEGKESRKAQIVRNSALLASLIISCVIFQSCFHRNLKSKLLYHIIITFKSVVSKELSPENVIQKLPFLFVY